MLKAIKDFYEANINPATEVEGQSVSHRLQLATAALLIEMAQADNQRHSLEFQAVHDGIMDVFDLTAEETAEVIELADLEAHEATDHFEFTQLINEQFDYSQKCKVVDLLWRVCLADSEMNRYEEQLARKITELLHVEHKDFIAAKLRVQREYSASGHLDDFDNYA
ncbi:TerB family tellurite resistance protein [Spiribacter sp. 2438]|uniref:tellurite resistance TerB family protein n=1 Tax=Spiribacter sp. 2438 TaxID=2666185 RepID=UPI0012AF1021|nr:TerB family tellurite resistance protein [Spiribacter sp. 2438]QGM22041.1 TerB family tellurite resistance protein [Spiribacter sp. 2438]